MKRSAGCAVDIVGDGEVAKHVFWVRGLPQVANDLCFMTRHEQIVAVYWTGAWLNL